MKKDFDSSINFERLQLSHLESVVDLHMRAFPDYFLSHLGPKFLSLYYKEYVDGPGNYGIVAMHNDRVVGFTTGTIDSSVLYNRFYKRNFFSIANITVRRFYRDPYIRKTIMSRSLQIKTAMRTLLPTRSRREVPATSDQDREHLVARARVLSTAVDPEFRRRGVAERLREEVHQCFKRDGVDSVGSSVLNHNTAMMGVLIKLGFQVVKQTKDHTYFYKKLD
jgi:ribosomal protein S18 acetylase RimI-like enzyme